MAASPASPASTRSRLQRPTPPPIASFRCPTQTLPNGLARDVLSSVLVPSVGHLRTAAGSRHDLDAPCSAHAALDLHRAAEDAIARLLSSWGWRFAQAAARAA